MPQAAIHTKRFIHCPHCGQSEHQVEGLFQNASYNFGPWRCHECNHEFIGRVVGDTVEITSVVESDREPVVCLFRFRDLYLVVKGYTRQKNYEYEWYDYLFHSHQCPVNILRSVHAVYCPHDGNDPHGVIRFIAAIPDVRQKINEFSFDPGEQDIDCGTLEELFRVFGTDGTDAPTNWPESQRGLLPFIAQLQDAHRKTTSPKA